MWWKQVFLFVHRAGNVTQKGLSSGIHHGLDGLTQWQGILIANKEKSP